MSALTLVKITSAITPSRKMPFPVNNESRGLMQIAHAKRAKSSSRIFQIAMKVFLVITAALILSVHHTKAEDIQIEDFMSRCEKKVIVMGRNSEGKIVRSGERLDNFCEGFLRGYFTALLNSRALCLKDKDWPSGEFLLNLVQTYRQEQGKLQLAELIDGALRRVYYCN